MANKTTLYGPLFFFMLTIIVGSRESSAASAPTVSIAASPAFVTAGEQSRITWSSNNATGCVATGNWTGAKALSDSKNTRHLTSNETFILTCTGPGGTASNHVTVTVTSSGTATAAPTVTISANPSTVTTGNKSTVSWSTAHATSCTASGAWTGSEALSGTDPTAALKADATYALRCTGPGGTTSESVTVSVKAAPVTGDATLSWAAPTTNTNGTPVVKLLGYHLYYGNTAGELTKSVAITNATATSFEITGLTAGTWYFAVAADASDGTEGPKSSVGSKTI